MFILLPHQRPHSEQTTWIYTSKNSSYESLRLPLSSSLLSPPTPKKEVSPPLSPRYDSLFPPPGFWSKNHLLFLPSSNPSTGSGPSVPTNTFKPYILQTTLCQPCLPQARILPFPFPSVERNQHSSPLSCNFHSLSRLPSPITRLVTKGTKTVQLVKSVPGPLSRLPLKLSMACGIANKHLAEILSSLDLGATQLVLLPLFCLLFLCLLSRVCHPGHKCCLPEEGPQYLLFPHRLHRPSATALWVGSHPKVWLGKGLGAALFGW